MRGFGWDEGGPPTVADAISAVEETISAALSAQTDACRATAAENERLKAVIAGVSSALDTLRAERDAAQSEVERYSVAAGPLRDLERARRRGRAGDRGADTMSTGGGHPDTYGRAEPSVGPSTPSGVSSAHRYRHGQDLDLVCRQCGTSWRFTEDAPTQCPDCLDRLGEPAP